MPQHSSIVDSFFFIIAIMQESRERERGRTGKWDSSRSEHEATLAAAPSPGREAERDRNKPDRRFFSSALLALFPLYCEYDTAESHNDECDTYRERERERLLMCS